jgi:hypothetical protein
MAWPLEFTIALPDLWTLALDEYASFRPGNEDLDQKELGMILLRGGRQANAL